MLELKRLKGGILHWERMADDPPFEVIDGEQCPFCNEKTLSLTETPRDIPYFGVCHIFSMTCSSCKYHKADVKEKHLLAR